MRDTLLQCAGWLAIVTSLAHGVLGETKVFARASIQPTQVATLIRAVWQAGTVAWIAGGVLLLAAPGMGSDQGMLPDSTAFCSIRAATPGWLSSPPA